MQEQENILLEGHRSTFKNIKSAIWDRTHPTYTSNLVYMCAGGFRGPKSSNNWVISICSRLIVIFLIWVSSAQGVGKVGRGYLGWTTIVYMSSGVFRGKESSNKIELSRLVQDLLNFDVLGSLWLWGLAGGWGGYLWAWWCPYMHAHTHMYTCKKLQMAVNIEASMFIMFNMHVCVCMHVYVHACVHGTPQTPIPTPIHLSATLGGPQNQ